MKRESRQLTFLDRQSLLKRELESGKAELAAEDQSLVGRRLADHHQHPKSSVPMETMRARVRSRFSQ